ncbi:ArsA-related P-loop ATPase [Nocardioides convexus]|uniref:ArsA-related P-loop ATPase n=1 Tax=Nocardioides convexus TaxID=2712224 RepID=UPI0024185A45|nr:ArsA-related P-loop ATPase [Nocardioides convexus]
MSDWGKVRLHVVTGKGGTGKSTVASALALALATRGKNVLLCEVEGRQGIARMFDVEPLPYQERRLTTGLPDADGGRGIVHALHIDAESALLEYLAMYYRLGRAGRALDKFGVIEFATTIAPGVRDVLLTGKVYEAVQRNSRNKNAIDYDAVVLDAPPTGRITQFLNVSNETRRAGQGRPDQGAVRHDDDPLPLAPHGGAPGHRAGGDAGAGDRRRHRRACAPPVCRSVEWSSTWSVRATCPPTRLAAARAGTLDRSAIETDLRAGGIEVTPDLVDGLVQEAAEHAERRALEDSQRSLVADLGVPSYEPPADGGRHRPRRALRARRTPPRAGDGMNHPTRFRTSPAALLRRTTGRGPR